MGQACEVLRLNFSKLRYALLLERNNNKNDTDQSVQMFRYWLKQAIRLLNLELASLGTDNYS